MRSNRNIIINNQICTYGKTGDLLIYAEYLSKHSTSILFIDGTTAALSVNTAFHRFYLCTSATWKMNGIVAAVRYTLYLAYSTICMHVMHIVEYAMYNK